MSTDPAVVGAVGLAAGRVVPGRCRVVAGERLVGILADRGLGREVLDDGVGGGRERYGDQGAGDAGEQDPGGDRDDHAERVDRDEAAHQERLQHVALDLLHQHDDTEHDQRHDDAVVDQRDQHRHRAGDEGADDRDEGAEEDQHADREHELHLQDRGARSSRRPRR